MLSDSTTEFSLATCNNLGEPTWENSLAVGFNPRILVRNVQQAGNKLGEPSWDNLHAVGFNNVNPVSDELQAINKQGEPSWENSLAVGFRQGILVSGMK